MLNHSEPLALQDAKREALPNQCQGVACSKLTHCSSETPWPSTCCAFASCVSDDVVQVVANYAVLLVSCEAAAKYCVQL